MDLIGLMASTMLRYDALNVSSNHDKVDIKFRICKEINLESSLHLHIMM